MGTSGGGCHSNAQKDRATEGTLRLDRSTVCAATAKPLKGARRLKNVLVVAEWSYLAWGERVQPKDGLSFLHLEWIDLHRGDYFAGVVAYLRGMLDALDLDDAERAETKTYFDAAVQCERDFWLMARAETSGEL